MDLKAFEKMSYGLYLISSKTEDITAGCVVNTLAQATASPLRMTVTINKQNYTTQIIEKSGLFTGAALSQAASMELIGAFGFHSSKDTDKFKGFQVLYDLNGIPYVSEQTVAHFSCRVLQSMDAGTHTIFLGEVLEADVLSNAEPMTYAYYHQVKRGRTPPKASSYVPEPAKGYRCKVCGYTLESDTIPEGFVCPVCGRGKEELEKVTA